MQILSAAFILLHLLGGCSPKSEGGLAYTRYEVKEADVSLEVPSGWRRFGARWNGYGGAPKGPAFTRFIAQSEPQHEGVILGAYLSLTRVVKKEDRTDSEDALFSKDIPGVTKGNFGGMETREYLTEYRYKIDDETIAGIDVPMKSEGIVFNRPDAYFILEYRANTQVYDKYRPALDRAKASLTFES